MKETPLSNSEKSFIINVISNNQRLDGRDLNQFRAVKINYGSDWGSVHVSLGETRVLVQITCEVAQPKPTRPTEGTMLIKVELGPMAAPNFEANRQSDQSIQINRILERAFKDSNCVDMESLCIVADEKVWNLKVDLNVLNHEGNIIDCASIGVLAALAHFKRPDVTINGDEVIIHTLTEKDPIPIVLHHYPVCVSYAIFQNGEIAIADPTAIEERVAEANLVFGLNSYRELCGLHFGGVTMSSAQLLLKCANRGAKQAKLLVDAIKDSIKQDEQARAIATNPVTAANGKLPSFTECVRLNKITSLTQDRITIKLKRFRLDRCTRAKRRAAGVDSSDSEDGIENVDSKYNPPCLNKEKDDAAGGGGGGDDEDDEEEDESNEDENLIINFNDKSAALLSKRPKWIPDSDLESNSDSETIKTVEKKKPKRKHPKDESESEEDETMILDADESTNK